MSLLIYGVVSLTLVFVYMGMRADEDVREGMNKWFYGLLFALIAFAIIDFQIADFAIKGIYSLLNS